MFIKTYHPKNSMLPTRESILKILNMGWIAQPKMNGFQTQLHISSEGVVNFTRQGTLHKRDLPENILCDLMSLFPQETVVLGEWVQHEEKIYLFDMIKSHGEIHRKMSYMQRYELLPEDLIAAQLGQGERSIEMLPICLDVDSAYEFLMDDQTEGLVFRNPNRKGFDNTSIVRCRRTGISFQPLRRVRK